MNKRIILVGKGGSGKDFFKEYLREKGYPVDVSYTTRKPRQGEVKGETYHYITEYQFDNMDLDELFYESVTFNGWKYATTKKDWVDRSLCIKTPSGIKQLTKQDVDESIIVYFDIDRNVRFERLSKRKDADDVGRRLAADTLDFHGFETFHIRITDEKFRCKELLETIEKYDLV